MDLDGSETRNSTVNHKAPTESFPHRFFLCSSCCTNSGSAKHYSSLIIVMQVAEIGCASSTSKLRAASPRSFGGIQGTSSPFPAIYDSQAPATGQTRNIERLQNLASIPQAFRDWFCSSENRTDSARSFCLAALGPSAASRPLYFVQLAHMRPRRR